MKSAMWRIAYIAKPAAIVACMLLASCAENKPPPPVAEVARAPVPMVPPGTTQDFFLNVGDRVFFTENSTELSSTAIATLNKQIAWLSKYPRYRITIEGHADEKGSKKKNMKLSEQRAKAVRDYLESHDMAPGRIRVVSYGREKRVAICNDASCWSQNRRVVTVLDTAGGPMSGAPPLAQQPEAPSPARLPVYSPRG